MTEQKTENAKPETAGKAEQADQTDQPAKFATVDLAEPITRGDTTISSLTLRKPKAGELRGLSLTDVVGLDISALLKLIPRISDPSLTDEEAQGLDPADLTECGGAIRGFFMTKAERKVMEAMIEEHQPKT